MTGKADYQLEWFDELEKRIGAAAAELTELRKKNRSLLAKAQRLERQVSEGSAASPGWEEEKKKLRTKVEKLSQTLESLLSK